MTEKENPIYRQGQEDEQIDVIKLLAGLGEINQGDFDNFRTKKVKPEYLEFFDVLTENDKRIIVAIDKLPDDQIKKLIKVIEIKNETKEKHIIIGIHEIRNHLLGLFNLTGDERYEVK